MELLFSLVDKSLVVSEERAGTARYRLLETVRQYARDRLLGGGESETVRVRHLAYFLALAEEAEPKLTGPEQAEWFRRLEHEHENVRGALEWSLRKGEEEADGSDTQHHALRLCGAMSRFWWTRGHLSNGHLCARVLEMANGTECTTERAKALNGAGNLARLQGDYPSARVYHEESLAIRREIGDLSGIAGSTNNLGLVAYYHSDYASARAYYEESLAISRDTGHRPFLANALNNLGNMAYSQSDFSSARAYHEESMGLFREIGDRNGIGASLYSLGLASTGMGDYARARTYYEESMVLFRETGHREFLAKSLKGMGNLAAEQGDYAYARVCHVGSLAVRREIGDRKGTAGSLEAFARLAAKENRSELAAVLWGAA